MGRDLVSDAPAGDAGALRHLAHADFVRRGAGREPAAHAHGAYRTRAQSGPRGAADARRRLDQHRLRRSRARRQHPARLAAVLSLAAVGGDFRLADPARAPVARGDREPVHRHGWGVDHALGRAHGLPLAEQPAGLVRAVFRLCLRVLERHHPQGAAPVAVGQGIERVGRGGGVGGGDYSFQSHRHAGDQSPNLPRRRRPRRGRNLVDDGFGSAWRHAHACPPLGGDFLNRAGGRCRVAAASYR